MVSSAYLRLLIFLLAILIPACASSSPAFRMMYSAYKLNKQGDNIQPWRTPLPIWNQSVLPCTILTVASWPAYRFLRRQVRWSGIAISKNFPQFVVIHTVFSGVSFGFFFCLFFVLFLDFTCKWDHIVLVFLWLISLFLTYFTWHNAKNPCSSQMAEFFSFSVVDSIPLFINNHIFCHPFTH